MKSTIVALPILLQIAVVAVLYYAAATPAAPLPSPVTSATEIHQLRQQRDQIEAKLAALESRSRVFLPRGMGGAQPPQPTQEKQ